MAVPETWLSVAVVRISAIVLAYFWYVFSLCCTMASWA